jgi:hypothetical protein
MKSIGHSESRGLRKTTVIQRRACKNFPTVGSSNHIRIEHLYHVNIVYPLGLVDAKGRIDSLRFVNSRQRKLELNAHIGDPA